MVEKGEPPEETAARELREETGYTAGDIILIGKTHPVPAFMTNTSYTFFSDHLMPGGKQELDSHELLDTIIIPIRQAETMINRGAEEFCNSQTIVSFYWWSLHRRNKKNQT
jgi:8-oxo-dGTP pyrophosphatase MutT (NUDIX family)